MLVVIAIIAILAALITPAIFQAMWTARQSRIKTEVDQIASGFEAFKAKYGSYPPANLTINSAGTNNPALVAFVAKAFPRYTLTTASSLGAQIYTDLNLTGAYQASCDTTNFNPQRALAFWLSGLSPDVTDPFNHNNVNVTRTPFFTFDPTRLIDSSTSAAAIPGTTPIGRMVYNAPYGSTAYAYFDYQSYGSLPTTSTASCSPVTTTVGPMFASTGTGTTSVTGTSTQTLLTNGTGFVVPYFADVNGNGTIDLGESYCKPNSFQVISAGQDGAFGSSTTGLGSPTVPSGETYRLFPIGVGYDPAGTDGDNLTNFNEKSSLDAAKP
jgi:Tfp pilus assembly protein PilE